MAMHRVSGGPGETAVPKTEGGMMSLFGDYEPEDAWNADDPPRDQVINLRRRLGVLLESGDGDLLAELALFAAVLMLVRDRRNSPRDVLRADDLAVDIDYVRERLQP